MSEDEPAESRNTLVKALVAIIIALVLGAAAAVICLPLATITGLTILGNELERSFNSIERAIDEP